MYAHIEGTQFCFDLYGGYLKAFRDILESTKHNIQIHRLTDQ